ncbi:hypothetical protein ACFOOP_04820 [Marinicaulis aureus]|uniref:DUF2474 domain-containing protein n=1 Tax=Hyphococcus aureus TaxID=2666033 RepID=A0ABW1KUE3_9PROT
MAERFTPVGPPSDNEKPAPLGRRFFWFFALALASLAAVASLAYLLRAILFSA